MIKVNGQAARAMAHATYMTRSIGASVLLAVCVLVVRPAFAERVDPRAMEMPTHAEVRVGDEQDIFIWNDVLATKGTKDDTELMHRHALLCVLGEGDKHGQCDTVASPSESEQGPFNSKVALVFENATMRRRVVLALQGHKIVKAEGRGEAHYSLSSTSINPIRRPNQPRIASGEVRYSLKIPASELKKLPFGGVWKARLVMRLMEPRRIARTPWTSDVTLAIKDAPQIFLPSLDEGSPHLDVPLTSTGGRWSTGEASFEACLYDGFGGASSTYRLTIAGGASRRDFSLVRGQGTGPADRIQYEVLRSGFGGGDAGMMVSSGEVHILPAVSNLRPVGKGAVCAPLRIRIRLVPFDPSRKLAGDYEGSLRLEYTPVID